MPIQNVGSDIIEAYLKGVATRQQKEHQLLQLRQQMEIAKMREAYQQEQQKIAKGRLDELIKHNEATEKLAGAKQNWRQTVDKLTMGKLVKDFVLIPDDNPDNPTGLKMNLPEKMQEAEIAHKVNEYKAMTQPAVERQQEMDLKANLPTFLAKQAFTHDKALDIMARQQTATALENRLTREAAMDRLKLRLKEQGQAKKAEDQQLINDFVASHSEDVLAGRISREDLRKELGGDKFLKVDNAFKSANINMLGKDNQKDLAALQIAQNLLQKARTQRDYINSWKLPSASQFTGTYTSQENLMNADLDSFSRAFKGYKSAITERDTERTKGLLPSALPGGKYSLGSKPAQIREQNNKRIEELEDLLQEKLNLMTRGMTNEQREVIRHDFQIENPPVRGLGKLSEEEKKKLIPYIGAK
jgi:hypothetical protein